MKPNIGILDSLIRIALGMVLIGTGLSFNAWWGLFGLIPIVTYLFKWSLMYHLFGINTHEWEKKLFKNNG